MGTGPQILVMAACPPPHPTWPVEATLACPATTATPLPTAWLLLLTAAGPEGRPKTAFQSVPSRPRLPPHLPITGGGVLTETAVVATFESIEEGKLGG